LEPLPRKLVHGHGVWHRVAHVWLQNDAGQLLCQQRSLEKELNPGLWEAFFGGHIGPDESYESAATREIREEIGIAISAADLRLWKIYQQVDPSGYNNEFQGIFAVRWNGDPKSLQFADGEVAQVAWKNIADIKKAMTTDGAEKWSNCGYELELLENLNK
jgi:isopentenyldiphosphate isomerase